MTWGLLRLGGLVCCVATAAVAVADGTRGVTFVAARTAAMQHAPEVLVAEGRAEVATTEVQVAGTLQNPTLTVTTARQTARLGTGVSVPLPLFGQRRTAIGAARADAAAAALDVTVVRREARWAATVAWADLWEAQERARRLGAAARDADRVFGIAGEKFAAGSGARLDVVRTRADRARAGAEAQAAATAVAAAAARLAPWIGAELHDALAAAGAPGYHPELPALAGLTAGLPAHPVLRRDRRQIQAAELHLRSEERLRWPLVNAQLTINQGDPTLPGTDFIFGLSFDLPVLNLRGGAIARARAQRALVETTARVEELRLRAAVVDAYERTTGARARLQALRDEVLPAMEEARAMTEEGYREGRVELLRVLEAQRALLDSRLAEAEALATWTRAVADLERALGTDLASGAGRAP
ncbi:MAG TPA: TolC family protein [Polyangia bacterium]|jgi:cobalt-zinc-cadmium efflux system outer membrane protein